MHRIWPILAKLWINEEWLGTKPALVAALIPVLIIFLAVMYVQQTFPKENTLVESRLDQFYQYDFTYGKKGEVLSLLNYKGERWVYDIRMPKYFEFRNLITSGKDADVMSLKGSPGPGNGRSIYVVTYKNKDVITYADSLKYYNQDRYYFPIIMIGLIFMGFTIIPGVIFSTKMYRNGKLNQSIQLLK